MASKAVVRPSAVFEAGSVVALWRVKDEGVQSHRGGELVDTRKADDAGQVEFSKGVQAGERYIAFAYVGGFPREVRCSGSVDPDAGLQAPVEPSVVKHADGQVADPAGRYAPLRVEEDVPTFALQGTPAKAKAKAKRAPRKRAAKKKTGAGDSAPVKSTRARTRGATSAAKQAAPKATAASATATSKSKG